LIKNFTKNNIPFLLLSFLIGCFFAFKYLGPQLSNPYSVQDDFRQSFFWVWQYIDSSVLPGDFFAEMYKSHIVRLPILNALFHFVANMNWDLILFSKYFALVISILSTLVAYLFVSTISSNKWLNLAFTVFLSFVFYCTDHISAAQARSFIWIGLMLYMFFKNKKMNISAALTCFILLFLSPNTFLLCLGMEGFSFLIKLFKTKQFSIKSLDFISPVLNAVSAFVLYKVIFKDIQTQGVGTPFTKMELKTLPEFNPGGRHPIFGSHFWDGTWFRNEHWGFGYGYLEISKIIFIGLAAFVIYFVIKSLLENKNIHKLDSILLLSLSSLSLYFFSQLVFPLLYLPSRYIAVPAMILAVIFVFLAFEVLAIYFTDNVKDILSLDQTKAKLLETVLYICFALSLILYFTLDAKKYIHLRYVSMNSSLAKSFAALPKDALIAGYPVLPDLNSASIITKRKVFVDYERSMAYTKESLTEIRRRNKVALAMTFANTKEEFLTLAKANGITHFLALFDLYSPQFIQKAQYLKPYNTFLRNQIVKSGGEFFVRDYLKETQHRYHLIDISKIN
jgi:hypothetical protein